MSLIAQELFGGADLSAFSNGRLDNSSTPNTWTQIAAGLFGGSTQGSAVIAAGSPNKVRQGSAVTGSATGWLNSAVCGGSNLSDYDVQMDFNVITVGVQDYGGLIIGANTTDGKRYEVSAFPNGTLNIQKTDAGGTGVTLATVSGVFTAAGVVTIGFRRRIVGGNAVLTGFVNGTQAVTVTDSTTPYITAGFGGWYIYNNGSGTPAANKSILFSAF